MAGVRFSLLLIDDARLQRLTETGVLSAAVMEWQCSIAKALICKVICKRPDTGKEKRGHGGIPMTGLI